MKKSNYNFFYEYDKDPGKIIAYNSKTNALAMIEKIDYLKYKDYIEEKKPIGDDKLVNDLIIGGYLVKENIDELELLRFNQVLI